MMYGTSVEHVSGMFPRVSWLTDSHCLDIIWFCFVNISYVTSGTSGPQVVFRCILLQIRLRKMLVCLADYWIIVRVSDVTWSKFTVCDASLEEFCVVFSTLWM